MSNTRKKSKKRPTKAQSRQRAQRHRSQVRTAQHSRAMRLEPLPPQSRLKRAYAKERNVQRSRWGIHLAMVGKTTLLLGGWLSFWGNPFELNALWLQIAIPIGLYLLYLGLSLLFLLRWEEKQRRVREALGLLFMINMSTLAAALAGGALFLFFWAIFGKR